MKSTAALFCLALYLPVLAQNKESYYDLHWKPCKAEQASFYSIVEKTDSGWLQSDYFIGTKTIQMQALYEDAACKIQNGPCYYFHVNGKIQAMGRMMHNKEEGAYTRYYSNGMMSDSAFYHDGIPAGSRMKWHRNGFMSDSIYHVNDSLDIQISWFDDGGLASAGYLLRNKPFGKWKFYHHNGNLSGEEVYKDSVAVSKIYYNEDGSLKTDTSGANKQPSFKGGMKDWTSYVMANVHWPEQFGLNKDGTVSLMVEYTVNEEGKIENEEIVISLHPAFDKVALELIHNSPQWQPGTAHNRKVKFTFRQPISYREIMDQ